MILPVPALASHVKDIEKSFESLRFKRFYLTSCQYATDSTAASRHARGKLQNELCKSGSFWGSHAPMLLQSPPFGPERYPLPEGFAETPGKTRGSRCLENWIPRPLGTAIGLAPWLGCLISLARGLKEKNIHHLGHSSYRPYFHQ